jgi:hypothetical protein
MRPPSVAVSERFTSDSHVFFGPHGSPHGPVGRAGAVRSCITCSHDRGPGAGAAGHHQ